MKTYLLSAALTGTLLLAGQATATDLLQDDDLDRMTAAGDPVVIKSEGATLSQVAYLEDTEFQLNIPKDAQVGLRALTVQNVVGELQLLVNLNVLSAANNVAGTDQRNFSLQSWGSTLPDAETVKTVAGSAAAPCMADGACNGGKGGKAGDAGDAAADTVTVGAITIKKSDNSPATVNAVGAAPGGSANGGNGGDGPLFVKGNGAVSDPKISNAASASGDVIIVSKSSNGESKVAFDNQGRYTLSFESLAQRDLSALFISNVVGRAQMALNLNIAAASLNLIPGSGEFASPLGSTDAVVKQVNTGMQFRGTPLVGSSGTTGFVNTTIMHTN